MAVKYTRDAEDSARARISERLGTREPVRRGGLFSFQQGGGGGGMILSLGAVIAALMLYQGFVDRMQAEPAPDQVETALGTVIGKAEVDPEAFGDRPMLQLRLETVEGVVREVWVPTDTESWEVVAEGDVLEVEYAVASADGSLRVQRLRAPTPDD